MEISSAIVRRAGAIERAFHLHQRLVIRQADAIFEPMVDLGGREPPLAADAPARQLAALCQLHYRRRHHVQVCGQPIDVEVFLSHESHCTPRLFQTGTLTQLAIGML